MNKKSGTFTGVGAGVGFGVGIRVGSGVGYLVGEAVAGQEKEYNPHVAVIPQQVPFDMAVEPLHSLLMLRKG